MFFEKIKILLFAIMIIIGCCLICSCNDQQNETNIPEEEKTETKEPFSLPEGVTKYQVFPAPTSNPDEYRKIARNYMYSMYDVTWTPKDTFTIKWEGPATFGVNLTYKKGVTYHGITYSNNCAPLCEFKMLVNKDKTYSFNNYYYEHTVGNHCSSSMVMAYQQLVPMTYAGNLKPSQNREGILEFPTDLKTPKSATWYSKTLFDYNGKDKIMEAYAALDMGDILYKNIEGSGHTRMVDKVCVIKKENGQIDSAKSYIETIEQTNQFDSTRTDGIKTTWWIDHKYKFDTLFSTNFMPVTLCIYRTKEPLEDAYIWVENEPTPDNLATAIQSTVIHSNFPLAYIRMIITNDKGENVKDIFHYGLQSNFSETFRKDLLTLKLEELPKGKYTYKLDAGIARGDCTLDSFEFTVE